MMRVTSPWSFIAALVLAAAPMAAAATSPDWPTSTGPLPGSAAEQSARGAGSHAAPHGTTPGNPPAGAHGVHPGDAFGAASPEIEELAVEPGGDAASRQRLEWIESVWNAP